MRDETFIRPGLQVRFAIVDSASAILPAIAANAPEQPQERTEVIERL
jgi:hypothetical protein